MAKRTVRWTLAAGLLALAGCAHPRSADGPMRAEQWSAEMMRCAASQAAALGYAVGPGDASTAGIRAEKTLMPEGGWPASTGVLIAWVSYGRDSQPRFKVHAERWTLGDGTATRPTRGVGGQPIPVPGGTVTPSESGGRHRIPPGRVATDAGQVETACRDA